MLSLVQQADLQDVIDRLVAAEKSLVDLKAVNIQLQNQVNQLAVPKLRNIPSHQFWNFPADVGAMKLTSTDETTCSLTFSSGCYTVAQYEDQKFARPDRMALDLVTLGKGSVDFLLYAWSAEQAVNSAMFSSTPTLQLIKTVTMATDIDNHRYHKYFSLSQDEIDAIMSIPTKYGLNFCLRYKAQPNSLMSSLTATLLTAYKV